jgi:hypothetical protein
MTPLEARLNALAAAGETVTYGSLARDLGLRMGELTAALEALMDDDHARGRPLRAAVCAQRLSPDAQPAPGFFQKASALGFQIDDPATFVATERSRLQSNGT